MKRKYTGLGTASIPWTTSFVALLWTCQDDETALEKFLDPKKSSYRLDVKLELFKKDDNIGSSLIQSTVLRASKFNQFEDSASFCRENPDRYQNFSPTHRWKQYSKHWTNNSSLLTNWLKLEIMKRKQNVSDCCKTVSKNQTVSLLKFDCKQERIRKKILANCVYNSGTWSRNKFGWLNEFCLW